MTDIQMNTLKNRSGYNHVKRNRERNRNILRRLQPAALYLSLFMALFFVMHVSASEEIIIGLRGSVSSSAPQTYGTDGSAQAGDPDQPDETVQSQEADLPGVSGLPDTDADDSWCLILVNRDHPIPDDYQIPALTELSGGNAIDSRVYPYLQKMFDDARSQGIYPYITSSFRTMEKQQQLMDDKIQEYVTAGYSQEEATALAGEWVAIPGTSEHQLGLSVDISVDESTGQDAGSVWYWLSLYSADYGFIKRYPEDKTDITGIINEPWHYRFVGRRAAAEMVEKQLCLEEYLEQR